MEKIKLQHILTELYKTNELLKEPYSGLYFASLGEHYRYIWIRDTYYQSKPSLKTNPKAYIQTYRSLLDYFKGLNHKYDSKIDHLIKKPFPLDNIRFIHPRLNPDLTEVTGNWGNLQCDIFGYFFLGIAEGIKAGLNIIRDESDIEITNKLIKVLYKIQYWTIEDSGIWEENNEIHSSSIGAVLSGLMALEEVDFIIPNKLLTEGLKRLNELLPRETYIRNVDLSLMTLIYPFNIITNAGIKSEILKNVHENLEKERGVIRYVGDKYYNKNGEAEWCFGFCYLFFAYIETDFKLAEEYLFKTINLLDENNYLPELYFSGTNKANQNNPLGWGVAMLILAIEKYLEVKI